MRSKNNIKIDIESLKIGVVGAGSWGTALAHLLGSKGFKLDLWVFEKEVKEQVQKYKENRTFLPGISLSPNIYPSNDLAEVISGKNIIVVVVPSHVMREIAQKIAAHASRDAIIVSASKGIENKTHLTMTGVLKDVLGKIPEGNILALSGPSFAREVAMREPTAVTVASKDNEAARFVQHVFAGPFFRVYTNDDVIGVELGGAIKNVIAIAAGMIEGVGFGRNARAAVITRSLTEIRRLGMKLGANPHTFAGLAGMGDLVLTCTGNISRNYSLGKRIGEGKKLKDILSEMRMVAEGVKTAKSVYNMSRKLGVEMPICHGVYHVLYDEIPPKEVGLKLMNRDLKNEFIDF